MIELLRSPPVTKHTLTADEIGVTVKLQRERLATTDTVIFKKDGSVISVKNCRICVGPNALSC